MVTRGLLSRNDRVSEIPVALWADPTGPGTLGRAGATTTGLTR